MHAAIQQQGHAHIVGAPSSYSKHCAELEERRMQFQKIKHVVFCVLHPKITSRNKGTYDGQLATRDKSPVYLGHHDLESISVIVTL